jgi:hypothetical protein
LSQNTELPQLNCKVVSSPNSVQLDQLSVGSDFNLNCEGLLPSDFGANLNFEFKEASDKYKLQVLEVQSKNAGGVQLLVTSYVPGDHKFDQLILSDGAHRFAVPELSWKVNSVLKKEEKPEVRPPSGPFLAAYPVWIWWSVGVLVALMAAIIFKVFRRRMQKNKLIARALQGDLSQKADTPYIEFNRSYRSVIRELPRRSPKESFKILDQAFRMFLLRRLLIPSFDWTTKEILRDIRKYHRRVYDECGGTLQKLLNEFEELKNAELSLSDVEQMMSSALNVVDKIDRIKGAKSS